MTEYTQLQPLDVLKMTAITIFSPTGERNLRWIVDRILEFPEFHYLAYHPNGQIAAILQGRDEKLSDQEIKVRLEVHADDRNAFIQRIYTMPLYRRVYIASNLLSLFEQFGRSQELIYSDFVVHERNKVGRAFFEHHKYDGYDSLLAIGALGYKKMLLKVDKSAQYLQRLLNIQH